VFVKLWEQSAPKTYIFTALISKWAVQISCVFVSYKYILWAMFYPLPHFSTLSTKKNLLVLPKMKSNIFIFILFASLFLLVATEIISFETEMEKKLNKLLDAGERLLKITAQYLCSSRQLGAC
jgi:hypothetical protein